MNSLGSRHTLHLLGLAALCVVVFGPGPGDARAQESWEIPDTALAEQAQTRQPITYFTAYDLNVSRSTWSQTLSYNHVGTRVSFGADASTNILTPVRGLETEGRDGSITPRLTVRATNRWLWSLDGLFDTSSNEDKHSSTKRRQNKVQLRTQYSAPILPGLTGTGLLFTELQQEQGLSRKSLPPDGLARDSTYTSGRRDGVSGRLLWTPSSWLQVTGTGSGNWNHLTTKTRQLQYQPVEFGEGMVESVDVSTITETPTGDERYETRAFYRGIPKTEVAATLRSQNGTQTMYAYTRRGLETLSWYDRAANLRVEHNPLPGGQVVVEGTVSRVFREYQLQSNLNALGVTHSGSANFALFRPSRRIMAGFQISRVRNDRQITQNGEIINRAMNASGSTRITDRLWLEGAGTLSLYSRRYDNPIADKDDQRAYMNVGGGYRVSSRCSTAVHFSVTRAHAVATDAGAASENNVQTSYQMDAILKLRVTPTIHILQNYQINANYFIYDFDVREGRNTLTRIRRIDTVLTDSLFDFAVLRLTHNFFAQDRGSYTRTVADGPREYGVSQESYVQNLSLMVGLRLFPGVTLSATQSLGNTRNYFYAPTTTTNFNRWNLNVGAQVDRTLPGDLVLQGNIQRIGEFTEANEKLPRRDEVDYWLAGASLQKDF
ncbi:MAG TPA: hypothetical protein VFP58_11705 [Candidatus Eisenbacteria bacterium]|nr:hypothetical protein [Candidatus Eisenbacteria bacterium]